MKIAIIGGGASGVICALKLKKLNLRWEISLFEASNKLLKKVSISGNGRCNLGNSNIVVSAYKNQGLISEMLAFKNDAIDFLHTLGILTYIDEAGRIYPVSGEAYSVVEILSRELFYRQVRIHLNTFIDKISLQDNKYLINGEIFDYVVVATGSNAGIKIDYNPYQLVNNLNLELTNLKPGLVGFLVKEKIIELSGVRAKVLVKAFNHQARGEMIFKKDGISGICIMDLSIFKNNEQIISIDFLPDFSYQALNEYIKARLMNDNNLKLYNLMLGTTNHFIVNFLNKNFKNKLVSEMSDTEINAYLSTFKEFKLTITDTYDLLNAQVVCGGVSLQEINKFESIKYPNLFLTGEVIDEVGICGGYNLWFAFTSGIMVAETIKARSEKR